MRRPPALILLASLALAACQGGAGVSGATQPSPDAADAPAPSDAEVRQDAAAEAEAEPQPEPDPDAEPQPEAGPEPAPEPGPEPALDAGAEPEADAASDAGGDVDGHTGPPPAVCTPGEPCVPSYVPFCYEGICDSLGQCGLEKIEGCCLSDVDCLGLEPTGPCEITRCVSNTCAFLSVPGCCAGEPPDECDDGLPCTVDTCTGVGGRCLSCPTPTCGCPGDPFVLDEDMSGAGSMVQLGFYAIDYNSADGVGWQLDQTRYVSPPDALYFGNPACRTYYSGTLDADCEPLEGEADSGQVRVTLNSPVLSLAGGSVGHVVLFWLWSEVEPVLYGGALEPDALKIAVQDQAAGGLQWTLATSTQIGKSTQGQWVLMALDLSSWLGQSVRLAFEFDTYDGQANHFEGLYLDDFQVVDRCLGGCCEVDADCPALSDDPCKETRCVDLTDGTGAVCAALPRFPGQPCAACTSDAECKDQNPCTTNTCEPDGSCKSSAFCCYEFSVTQTSFEADEGGLGAWFPSDDQPDDGVGWTTSAASAADGLQSAWFGDPATATYEAAGPVSGSLTSPAFDVPAALGQPGVDAGAAEASFFLNLQTEWDGLFYDNPSGLDRLGLELLESTGKAVEIWSSDEVLGTTGGLWIPVQVDIEPWAGQTVSFRFTFASGDEALNAFPGAFIDAFGIGRECP